MLPRQFLEDDENSTLLILSGDVPIIKAETLARLVQLHRSHRGKGAACTVLTVKLTDPSGYGRIVRDDAGLFERIVEQRDATDAEIEISEINGGIYCFETGKLFESLSKVQNNNSQGEYYLTDVPTMLALRVTMWRSTSTPTHKRSKELIIAFSLPISNAFCAAGRSPK